VRPATLILALDAAVLGGLLVAAPPTLALVACGPAGALGVIACELLDRADRRQRLTTEPWRLDGWMVLVGTLAVLGLALSTGPEAVVVAWLLVALLAALGFASLPNAGPRSRT